MKKSSTLVLICCFLWTNLFGQSQWSLAFQNPQGNFYGIYANSPEKVTACSEWGRIYQSTDGGQTMPYYQIENDFSIWSEIKFLNNQIGWIGGGCYFPTDECRENLIANTQDGGQSWTVVQLEDNLGVFHSLSLLSDGTLFALGDYAGLFRWDPQTQNWTNLGKPGGFLAGTYDRVQFFDALNGYVEHSGVENSTYINRLLMTDDGGQNWSPVASSDISPAFYFINQQSGFAMTSNGMLGRTSNGGMTWDFEKTFGQSEHLQKIDFVTPDVGHLATFQNEGQKSRIYRSIDGGESWVLDFALDSVYISDFHFADPENGYAIINWSNIYRRKGTVSTHSVEEPQTLNLRPNPAKSSFLVSIPAHLNVQELILTNQLGQVVQCIPVLAGQKEILVNSVSLQPGVYFIRSEGGPATKVVIRD